MTYMFTPEESILHRLQDSKLFEYYSGPTDNAARKRFVPSKANSTVEVDILYTAHLKTAAGSACETIQLPESSTLNDCFRLLCDRADESLRNQLLDDQGRLRSSILLCVDDEQLSLSDDRPLTEGAEITLLAAISGG